MVSQLKPRAVRSRQAARDDLLFESSEHTVNRSALTGASCLIGLALGGFFDGIVLHQILQWHHLLSGLNVAPMTDLRIQILADGLFHAAMYLVGIAGLTMLWKQRAAFIRPRAGRHLMCWLLVCFGSWHVIDAVLSHWLLGLHRIRQDASEPLLWDIGWLVGFGLLPLAVAWRMRTPDDGEGPTGPTALADSQAVRSNRGAAGDGRENGRGKGAPSAVWVAALLTLSAGAWNLRPPPDSGQALVVFWPHISATQAFNALGAADARLLWVDRSGGVWAVQAVNSSTRNALYRRGALFVGGGMALAGCTAWSSLSAENRRNL